MEQQNKYRVVVSARAAQMPVSHAAFLAQASPAAAERLTVVDNTVYADYVVDCRQDYGWLVR